MGLSDLTSEQPLMSSEPGTPLAPPPPLYSPLGGQAASFTPPQLFSPLPLSSQQGPPPAGPPTAAGLPYGAGAAGPTAAPPGGMSADEALRIARQHGGSTRDRWAPGTRTESREGVEVPDEWKQSQFEAEGANRDLAGATMEAEGEQGAARAREAHKIAAYDQIAQANKEQFTAQQQAQDANERAHMKALLQDAGEPAVVKDHYWASKSTGQRVATGISMMLQGFMFGRGAASDPAEWLNKEIRQDTDDQIANHNAKREAAGESFRLYGVNKEALGDEARARDATEMAKRATVIAQLDTAANDASAPAMARLRATQIVQKLTADNAKQWNDFYGKTAQKRTTTANEAFKPGGGGAYDPLITMRRAVEAQKLGNTLTGVAPEGRQAEANIAKTGAETKKLGTEGKASTAEYDNALDPLYEIHRMVVGGGKLSSKETGRGQALMGSTIAALAKAQGVKATMRDGKINPLIASQIGTDNPNAFELFEKNLGAVEQTIRNVAAMKSRASGATPGAKPPGFEATDTSGEGGDE